MSDTVAAYRAAAAKLAEALGATTLNDANNRVTDAARILWIGKTPAGESVGYYCAGTKDQHENPVGWRWITEAARLRLLAEALILEQDGRDKARWSYRKQGEIDAELGRLVRETLKEETP